MDKIVNLGSKGLMVIIIAVGVILSGVIMSYGNPFGLNAEDTRALGVEIAKEKGADKEMLSAELNAFTEKAGEEKKQELIHAQGEKVVTTMNFTIYFVIGLAVLLVVAALVMGIISAPKTFITSAIGLVAFVVLILIIYNMAGTDVPTALVERDAPRLVKGEEALFTVDNWKLAGAAMVSMIVLSILAVITAVGSGVYKMIKG